MPLFTTKRRRTSRRRRAAPARSSRTSSILLNPRRKRRKARKNYWPNNTQGHRSAARKGWRKRKVRLSLVKDRSGRKRRNPMRSRRRSVARRTYRYTRRSARRNPFRSRRRVRRNPLNLRTLTNKSTLMTAATIGIGLVAGWMTLPIVSKILPADWKAEIENPTGWGKARGLINVAIGVLIFSMLKNKRAKEIGIVIAGTGVYDLIAVNLQAQLGLPQLSASNTALDALMPAASGSYGTPGTHAASAMAGSYGQNMIPSYGPSAYGASYESPVMRAFGDDLDAFMS